MHVVGYPFQELDSELIREILIDRPGTVVYPTETFYALGCIATSPLAVEKVYALKKRDRKSPLLVLIDDWNMLDRNAEKVGEERRKLLDRHWPGPLTAVLAGKTKLARELNYSGTSLGFRMTSSQIAKELIRIVGVPLVGTSANLSSKYEISNFKEVRDLFGDSVDLYIDGGETPGGRPSTVVDMTGSETFVVVRKGAVELS
ncbi:MAG: threonylcarbamoyl-AMP synthase [Proteobacteria bacterium]|nr:threonylcarbamoyl-AMP synthase [Pseudomonadota bacterium]